MSQHWYSSSGDCAYTVVGKSGKERDTTLADARKMQLWPSVTTVIGCAAAPGLDNYKQSQLMQALLDIGMPDCTFVGYDDPNLGAWKSKVIVHSKKHSQDAAKRGSEIHDALEQYYKTNVSSLDEFIVPVIEFLDKQFPNAQWIAEKSFTNMEYGFGGKVDLHDPVNKIVLDFKTKDTDDVKKMVAYSNHHMQSAAYVVGLSKSFWYETCFVPNVNEELRSEEEDLPRKWKRYNLFISTQVPGLLSLTESLDFNRDWGMFYNLLRYWQLSSDHYPAKYL